MSDQGNRDENIPTPSRLTISNEEWEKAEAYFREQDALAENILKKEARFMPTAVKLKKIEMIQILTLLSEPITKKHNNMKFMQ